MYEKLNNCPICESTELNNKHICKDFLVGKESFVISECQTCGFNFTNPRPTIDHIGAYYHSEHYKSHQTRNTSLTDLVYGIIRNFHISHKKKIIQKYNKTSSILDIGCGTGEFLSAFKNAGWNTSGIEPDSGANSAASGKLKGPVLSSIDDLPQNSSFSVITLWHVLEHIHDLDRVLTKIFYSLNKGGTLFVAVPNRESYDAHYYNEYWAGWDVPRHLYHFNQKDMKNLVDKHKAKIVAKHPMLFDSYYVSLLSEQYKTGSKRFIKAIQTGRKSNKLAKINTNYSSILYVIKK